MFKAGGVVSVMCLVAVSTLGADQFARGEQRLKPFRSPEISIDYPDNWDAMTIPPTIAAFVNGPERSFTIEREQLEFSQGYDEIFAAHERTLVSMLYPDASAITQ